MIYTKDNIATLGSKYFDIMNAILTLGKNIAPRNNEMTLEIRPVTLEFTNPRNRILFLMKRDINPFFLAVESLWILSGRETVYPLNIYNSRMSNYSDDGIYYNAPYGKRLRDYGASYKYDMQPGYDQLKGIYNTLKSNKDSRQAVAVIWNPFADLETESKDIPCNDILMFKIRNNKLNLTIGNRSNDFHWGLPTNLFQFSMILEMMSFVLGVEIGNQVHNIDSLHIYTDNGITDRVKTANRMIDPYLYEGFNSFRFQLNENYLLCKGDLFDKTFFAIDETMLCIENFENDFNCVDWKDLGTLKEIFFNKNFLYHSINSKSIYLGDLVRFASCYFLFKKAASFYKTGNDNHKLLLVHCIDSLSEISQDDLCLSGYNFLYTRICNVKVLFEDKFYFDKMKQYLISKFENRFSHIKEYENLLCYVKDVDIS